MPSLFSCLQVSAGAKHQGKIVQDTSFGQLQTLHSEHILIVLRVLFRILLVAISITENYCRNKLLCFCASTLALFFSARKRPHGL
jgi:hypothetical protein